VKVGVLAIQGAVAEHVQALAKLDVETVLVRLPSDLERISALVIPGGESTTINKLLSDYGLIEPLQKLIHEDLPVLGTCAGMVLLAKKVVDSEMKPLGVMDIDVKRNAFGRQVDSFETELSVPDLGDDVFKGVFIRAPIIQKVEPNVEVLCMLGDDIVAARQDKLVALAFHPELTDDLRFHSYFLGIVNGRDYCKK